MTRGEFAKSSISRALLFTSARRIVSGPRHSRPGLGRRVSWWAVSARGL